MKKILLVMFSLMLISVGVFASTSTSTSLNFSASGQVINAVTVSWYADMVFPNNLLAGDNPSQITTHNNLNGSHPAGVTVGGCTADFAYVAGPAKVFMYSGSNSYAVFPSYPNPISLPAGNPVTFYIDGYINGPGTLVAGSYSGTLSVEAGCGM